LVHSLDLDKELFDIKDLESLEYSKRLDEKEVVTAVAVEDKVKRNQWNKVP